MKYANVDRRHKKPYDMLPLSAAIKHILLDPSLGQVCIVQLTVLGVLFGPHETPLHLDQGFRACLANERLVSSTAPHGSPDATLPPLVQQTRRPLINMKNNTLEQRSFHPNHMTSCAQHNCRLESFCQGAGTFFANLAPTDVKLRKRRVGLMKISRALTTGAHGSDTFRQPCEREDSDTQLTHLIHFMPCHVVSSTCHTFECLSAP